MRNTFSLPLGRGRTARAVLPLALLPLFLLAGCSGGGELSKKEDAELRNNFTRKLTPEEIARMGGGKPVAPPKKGE